MQIKDLRYLISSLVYLLAEETGCSLSNIIQEHIKRTRSREEKAVFYTNKCFDKDKVKSTNNKLKESNK